MMCGADGVSFVESLPQQFVVGKNRPGGGRGSRGPALLSLSLLLYVSPVSGPGVRNLVLIMSHELTRGRLSRF